MDENKNKLLSNSVVAIIVVIGIIMSSVIMSNAVVQIKGSNNRITVTGSAKQHITSDLIVWTGSFDAKSAVLQDAYTQLATDKTKVLNYLIKSGVAKNEIVFSSINTNINYKILPNGTYTSDIDYYDLNQTVTISSKEINKITDVSRNATELINEGIQFQSNSPQYLYTKIADLKITMLAAATKDATKRAQMMAQNAGSKLGDLKSADMGVIQITPLYSDAVSDSGMNDTYSLEKEITAIVHCSYEIK